MPKRRISVPWPIQLVWHWIRSWRVWDKSTIWQKRSRRPTKRWTRTFVCWFNRFLSWMKSYWKANRMTEILLCVCLPFFFNKHDGWEMENELPKHFVRFLIDLARLRTPNENKEKKRTDDDRASTNLFELSEKNCCFARLLFSLVARVLRRRIDFSLSSLRHYLFHILIDLWIEVNTSRIRFYLVLFPFFFLSSNLFRQRQRINNRIWAKKQNAEEEEENCAELNRCETSVIDFFPPDQLISSRKLSKTIEVSR